MADFVNNTGDPVFETTLNQALGVQLGQSPVLDIVSPRHLRQSLQYLGKKPDDAITPAIAREIGEREGIKAILTGTIANLGSDYIITLSAQNTATGDQIASVQTQAASKEKVLDALNQAAAQMRAQLGESLASIQKLNTPFGQATTPSLEAFRAYALGDEAHSKGNDIPEAVDHYKRALALDPKLAMAWARLGVIYLNSGQNGKAMEYFTKAHELSGDVSERERLYIEGHYYAEVKGDLDKAVETLQVAVQEYPLQIDNYVNLGVFYSEDGQPEEAREVLLKALTLQPDQAIALSDLISSYTAIDQYDEARKYVAKANQLRLNGTDLLAYQMALYGATGDTAGIQRILAEGAGRPDQFQLTGQWGNIQAQWGQFRAAAATLQRSRRAGRGGEGAGRAGRVFAERGLYWMAGGAVSEPGGCGEAGAGGGQEQADADCRGRDAGILRRGKAGAAGAGCAGEEVSRRHAGAAGIRPPGAGVCGAPRRETRRRRWICWRRARPLTWCRRDPICAGWPICNCTMRGMPLRPSRSRRNIRAPAIRA